MEKIKIGKILIFIGLAIYVIENMYFGWNKLPMSDAEAIADNVTRWFIYGGLWLYTMPIWSLYENAVKKHDASK